MSKEDNRLLNIEKINQYILAGLVLISLVLAVFFWRNPLTTYDASGHVALIRTFVDSWPSFGGWSSRELLGWPAGLFYPSFFHWLAAGLSFLVGVETAVKVLISVALITLPFSLAAFARSLTNNKFGLAIITLVLFILILTFPNFLGTGDRALFQIGLLSNFFVLPIFFFFLASLHKAGNNYLLPGILLSLIILTHIVAAIVAATYLVLFVASRFLVGEKLKTISYLKLVGLTAVLTAFFWLPFITNLSYTSVSHHVSSYLLPNVLVAALSFGLAAYSWRKKEAKILTLSLFSFLFAVIASLDAFLIRSYGTSFALYPFHIYRLQPFIYLFFTTAAVLLLTKWPRLSVFAANKLIQTAAFSVGFGLILLILFLKNPVQLPKAQFEIKNPDAAHGRFLETFRRSEVAPFWYGPQTLLTEKNQKVDWAYGLFTDSTPNGPYLGSLIKSLNRNAYPEGEDIFLETKFVNSRRTDQLLNLFGINYLISLEETKKDVVGTWSSGGETKYYNFEKISSTGLLEVPKLPLLPVEKDWNKKVEGWWLEKGPVEYLPYLSQESQPPPVCSKGLENTQVKIISANKQQTRFELEIASDTNVPVLAKISYFPYWRAFDKDGKEIPIFRAAPNLMLFSANGKVTLEYKEPIWIKELYFVSAATFLIVIFGTFYKKWKKILSLS